MQGSTSSGGGGVSWYTWVTSNMVRPWAFPRNGYFANRSFTASPPPSLQIVSRLRQQYLLYHFRFVRTCGILPISNDAFQLVLRHPLHHSGGLFVYRSPVQFLDDRVGAALIDFLQRVIVSPFPLLPPPEVADLTSGAPALVPWSQTAAVFCGPCIGGQEPCSADGAFAGRMTYTQALK